MCFISAVASATSACRRRRSASTLAPHHRAKPIGRTSGFGALAPLATVVGSPVDLILRRSHRVSSRAGLCRYASARCAQERAATPPSRAVVTSVVVGAGAVLVVLVHLRQVDGAKRHP